MTECPCSIDVDVDGQAQFHSSETRKARKKHKCGECNKTINVGESYEYVIRKWEGHLFIHKTCADCLSVRDTFFCGSYYYEMIWQSIIELIQDTKGQISSDCLLKLTPRAKEKMCEEIQAFWDNYYDDED